MISSEIDTEILEKIVKEYLKNFEDSKYSEKKSLDLDSSDRVVEAFL